MLVELREINPSENTTDGQFKIHLNWIKIISFRKTNTSEAITVGDRSIDHFYAPMCEFTFYYIVLFYIVYVCFANL